MNIWFVSIFENTPVDDNLNTRYNSLVQEALSRNHHVTFWASTFKHNVKKQRFDEDTILEPKKRLTLQFLHSRPYEKNISLKRLFSHRNYAERLVRKFEKYDEKPDLIMMAYPPVSVAEKVSEWADRNDIPCVADIIDPWPDVFSDHLNYLPGFLFSPMKNSVKRTMKRITAVTAISNQYIDWAKGYHPEISPSRCFYPAVQFRKMQDELQKASQSIKKSSGRFTVIYAGSLGYSYDIPCILEAASILEKKHGKCIQFIIAGDGPQKEKVEEYQKKHSNLDYVGRVSKEKLMEYYYLADMGCTQHIKGATQSVTYKLFDLLACGLPVLNSLESEMREIITENSVGFHNHPGDAESLAKHIEYSFKHEKEFREMQQRAIELTRRLGDSESVYTEAIDFLETLIRKPADVSA